MFLILLHIKTRGNCGQLCVSRPTQFGLKVHRKLWLENWCGMLITFYHQSSRNKIEKRRVIVYFSISECRHRGRLRARDLRVPVHAGAECGAHHAPVPGQSLQSSNYYDISHTVPVPATAARQPSYCTCKEKLDFSFHFSSCEKCIQLETREPGHNVDYNTLIRSWVGIWFKYLWMPC